MVVAVSVLWERESRGERGEAAGERVEERERAGRRRESRL